MLYGTRIGPLNQRRIGARPSGRFSSSDSPGSSAIPRTLERATLKRRERRAPGHGSSPLSEETECFVPRNRPHPVGLDVPVEPLARDGCTKQSGGMGKSRPARRTGSWEEACSILNCSANMNRVGNAQFQVPSAQFLDVVHWALGIIHWVPGIDLRFMGRGLFHF